MNSPGARVAFAKLLLRGLYHPELMKARLNELKTVQDLRPIQPEVRAPLLMGSVVVASASLGLVFDNGAVTPWPTASTSRSASSTPGTSTCPLSSACPRGCLFGCARSACCPPSCMS